MKNLNKNCFIISTIGEEGSEWRKLADEKYDLVFQPILNELEYQVTRADKVGSPGSISYDIVQRIINSHLVIADVSDINPNVFYELAIRNAIKKPVIIIKGIGQKMPFDIYDKRAISIDMKQARLWTRAKQLLREQIIECEKDPELASKSILTDFSFPIDTKSQLSPNNQLSLDLKDVKGEIRRLRNQIKNPSQSQLTDMFDDDNFDNPDYSITYTPRPESEIHKLRLFMDILMSLEGEHKQPVEEKLFITELVKSGEFTEKEARNYLRRMLREASIYESKPRFYNRI